ncbi:uncharacterized protein LOC130969072 [Arachis stenosperma]|uniref:uncharacterized protein LOC130969072 n=1 Tax=Arachis stenosperma TaxID=217475 RepID=UPI0025AD8407|nr:uncharacterized protein LOC130969072 [Arachis stenosperma]
MQPTSLLVPFVQELAKQASPNVPERYVRPQHERPTLSSTPNNHPLPQVPVIDFSKLLSQQHKEPELQNMHYACKHWGFFQLINHGVSSSLLENVKKGSKDFFNLPMEEKNKYRQKEGDIQGYGQLFVASEEQKLEWGDVFYMLTLPPQIRKPHLLPTLPQPFRDDLDTYCVEMKNLAVQVIELMADAVKVERKEMRKLFGDGSQAMRMNYYPACPQPELVMGLNPHSDGAALTILLQVNDVAGLQIKKDGQWLPVKPLPNALVINVGDILEMITNGIYQSIEHRAIVNAKTERISIATFYLPRNNLETYCAEMKKVAIQMVQLMANALRVDPMQIKEQIGEGTLSMRMNYYPPCPQPELVMGLNPHSDGSALTILLQVNEMQGLQIKKDGIWIPVTPLPNAFVINIGDIFEIITNGIYKSIEHRAIVNPDKERLSIATFYNAEPQRNLGPNLHHACKHWGFFQLINHGVSDSVVENVKKGVEEFFNLPVEEKRKFGQKEGDVEGYGPAFVVSEEQKLEWADMFFLVTMPPHLRKPHLFPNIPQPFRDNLEAYSLELEKLVMELVDLMANALQVHTMEIKEVFGGGTLSMRMNYYPPCPQPDLVLGLNPHSDADALTIILQANEIQGLQIKKDGMWIPVKPLPNAFTINIGDMFEMISNGIYRSIEHRATINSEKERISIATFYNPDINSILKPAPSLVTPETPAVFKTISCQEYYKGYLSRELRGRSYLQSMRLQNENQETS